jgi:glycosyltransferase involved in cell wall biosynthesis
VNQASSEWILVVDADELIPVALSRDLRRMADSGEADVVLLPRTNYLLGAVVRHTGWGGGTRDAQVRFFRKGFVVGTSVAHQDFKPIEGARIKVLSYRGDNAIVHFNYLDSQQFIERLNRYTSIEAKQAFERGERMTALGALLRGAKQFWYRYIRARGFRDGWRGFYLSLFMSFYVIVRAAKLHELIALGPRELIESRYRQEAEEILKAYGESQSPAAS